MAFFDHRVEYLQKCGRHGTAENYKRAKRSLQNFLDGRELNFEEMDSRFIDEYYDWLMQKGMVRNSASFHMRILRAVYNKGVKKGLVCQSFPFRDTYTGVDRTRKRCVGKTVIREILSIDLSRNSELSLARDLFLFSLYSRGMSFIDIAFLREENVSDEFITYERRKTRQLITVRIEKPLKEIIDKYRGGDYLFPILEGSQEGEEYQKYLRELAKYNHRLKLLSDKLATPCRLTSYVSRHTWASLAKKMDIPVSVISAGMGHTSERTTQIYLDSLENSVIDNANRRLITSIIDFVS